MRSLPKDTSTSRPEVLRRCSVALAHLHTGVWRVQKTQKAVCKHESPAVFDGIPAHGQPAPTKIGLQYAVTPGVQVRSKGTTVFETCFLLISG